MKIAILMSTYNGHRFLDKQLRSIAEQTVIEELELYIRDDGSSDDTFEIIERWKDKINITLFKGKNVGPEKSFWSLLMDTCIQADYYAFCDQDDIWDKDKLERGIKKIQTVKEPALWCSNCRLIGANDELLKIRMTDKNPNLSICSQLVCGMIQGCAMLFNNKLRDYILAKNPGIVPMHDIVVITYCSAVGNVIYDSVPSFSYRMHENNVVAKDRKSILGKVKSSFKLWFLSNGRNKTSAFASAILSDNYEFLDDETIDFLKNVENTKKHFLIRFKIIFSPLTRSINKSAERSFKIRALLGVL